jgi:hypothetical protein
MSRAILRFGLVLMVLLCAASAGASKKKDKPIKSNAGGAGREWACKKLAEAACDLAKRCEPDRAQRYCRKVRERCDDVKPTNAPHATDDDVGTCTDSLADLSCHQVTFDSVNGVNIDFKGLNLCSVVAQDNLLPVAKEGGSTPPPADPNASKGGDAKASDSKPSGDDDGAAAPKGKPSGDDDAAPKSKHSSDD